MTELDVWQALTRAAQQRGPEPVLTHVDALTGARTELSAATLRGWASKTADALTGELLAEPGDRVALLLPAHWIAVTFALGAWVAGLTVQLSSHPRASIALVPTGAELPDAAELLVSALHPFGMPIPGGPPPGSSDHAVIVRGGADIWLGPSPGTTAVVLAEPARSWSWNELTASLAAPAALSSAPSGSGAPQRWLVPDTLPATQWLIAATVLPIVYPAGVLLLSGAAAQSPEQRARLWDSEAITAEVQQAASSGWQRATIKPGPGPD